MLHRQHVLIAAITLFLAGCGGGSNTGGLASTTARPLPPKTGATAASIPPQTPRARRVPFRAAPTQVIPGVEGLIGSSAENLIRAFGTPRLDVREGDARKLQFTGTACVLDAYLYPPAEGRAPVTSYVDARSPDGRDVDRATCITALQKK